MKLKYTMKLFSGVGAWMSSDSLYTVHTLTHSVQWTHTCWHSDTHTHTQTHMLTHIQQQKNTLTHIHDGDYITQY